MQNNSSIHPFAATCHIPIAQIACTILYKGPSWITFHQHGYLKLLMLFKHSITHMLIYCTQVKSYYILVRLQYEVSFEVKTKYTCVLFSICNKCLSDIEKKIHNKSSIHFTSYFSPLFENIKRPDYVLHTIIVEYAQILYIPCHS